MPAEARGSRRLCAQEMHPAQNFLPEQEPCQVTWLAPTPVLRSTT